MNFSSGRLSPELAQTVSRVALAWHNAGGSTPFGVTHVMANAISEVIDGFGIRSERPRAHRLTGRCVGRRRETCRTRSVRKTWT